MALIRAELMLDTGIALPEVGRSNTCDFKWGRQLRECIVCLCQVLAFAAGEYGMELRGTTKHKVAKVASELGICTGWEEDSSVRSRLQHGVL